MNQPVADPIDWLKKNLSIDEGLWVKILQRFIPGQSITLAEFLDQKKGFHQEQIFSSFAQALDFEFFWEIPINEVDASFYTDLPINYCKAFLVLPYQKTSKGLAVVTSNPFQYQAIRDLGIKHGLASYPILAPAGKVLDAINRVYEKISADLQEFRTLDVGESPEDNTIVDLLEVEDDEAPIIRYVNSLIFRAVKEKASDIHVEPYEREVVVRFRVDGVLYTVSRVPKKLQNSIVTRIKVMSNLNIAEKRLPQDGRIPLRIGGKDIDIRVSTIPTTFGERVVMRLQDRSQVILSLEELGFSSEDLAKIDDVIHRSYGIFLVTGPTGSGKSTTLYACLVRINSPDINILTIEDPVEQRIAGISQVQVNPKIGLTFAAGLRAFLRQDPEVIMVGEIRDRETAELAIQASLTGHLVFSTLHTNDSASAFARLLDIGVEPFLVATSVIAVAAQRLVRVLCPHCKSPYEPTEMECQALGIPIEMVQNKVFYKPVGCDKCNGKGYQGRTLIGEVLMVDDEIRQLVLQRHDGSTIRKTAIRKGMRTFREHGIQKILDGITTVSEVLNNSQMD